MFRVDCNFSERLNEYFIDMARTGNGTLFSDLLNQLPVETGHLFSSVELELSLENDRFFREGRIDIHEANFTARILRFIADILKNPNVSQVVFDDFLARPTDGPTERNLKLSDQLIPYGNCPHYSITGVETKAETERLMLAARSFTTFYGTALFFDRIWSVSDFLSCNIGSEKNKLAESVLGFLVVAFDGDGFIIWERRQNTLVNNQH